MASGSSGWKVFTEYSFNARVPQASILEPTFFLLYINDLPDDALCNIAICANETTFFSKFDQAFDLWQQLEWLLNLNLINKTLWTGAESGLLISILEIWKCWLV